LVKLAIFVLPISKNKKKGGGEQMAKVASIGRLALLLLLPVGWNGVLVLNSPARDWEIGELNTVFSKELSVDLPKKQSFRFVLANQL
jgi:hypothetical protein